VQIEAARREGVLRVPNDALRYRPRGEAQSQAPARPGGDAGERQIERLRGELQLAPEQETALREGLSSMFAELRRSGQGGPESGQADPLAMRQRVTARIEQVLAPMLSGEQRQLYEKWKRGRETTRMATVWVLAPEGSTERRTIRVGLNDDQFTEVVGGQLKEGERVIIRARDAGK
jgi:HlyD family secretion protein